MERFGLQCLFVVCLVAGAANFAPAQNLDGGKFTFTTEETQSKILQDEHRRIIDRSGLYVTTAYNLSQYFRLQHDVAVLIRKCRASESPDYDPKTHSILLCDQTYETFYADARQSQASVPIDDDISDQLADASMLFIFFHEIAHALLIEVPLKIPGNHEYLADEFATLYSIQHDDGFAANEIMYYSAHSGEFNSLPDDPDRKFDPHLYASQRVGEIGCFLVGSDISRYQTLGIDWGMSRSREKACRNQYIDEATLWTDALKANRRK